MKTFVLRLDASIEADNIEEATSKAREVYESAENEGWNVHGGDVARAREDKPVELFSFGSSDYYQNPAAKQETETGATAS